MSKVKQWQLTSELEALFTVAHHPGGYIAVSRKDGRFAQQWHAKCILPKTIHTLFLIGREVCFIDGPLYAPHTCSVCGIRQLRVTTS